MDSRGNELGTPVTCDHRWDGTPFRLAIQDGLSAEIPTCSKCGIKIYERAGAWHALVRMFAQIIADDIEREECGLPAAEPKSSIKINRRVRPKLSESAKSKFLATTMTPAEIGLRKISASLFTSAPSAPGVYFLFSQDTAVYVGSTYNLRERLSAHRGRPHDGIAWIAVDEIYELLETYYIRLLSPPWNTMPGRDVPAEFENLLPPKP